MIRHVRSDIEDLDIPIRSSRESDKVGPEDCLSTGLSNRWGMDKYAQFHRAEKNDVGMA